MTPTAPSTTSTFCCEFSPSVRSLFGERRGNFFGTSLLGR
jgi:hypothetical protein